jgi:hypothetical protein
MKKYLFLIVVFALAGNAFAQSASSSGPVVTFEKNTHDFGDIHQGDKVEQTFKFTTLVMSLC